MIEEVQVYKKKPRKFYKTPEDKKKAARKRKREKRKDLWAEFGLKRPPKPRYEGLQGVLWFLVSKAVRMEEFALYGGSCVDGCGKKVESWQEGHCGHFQTAGRASTRFARENLGLQHKNCNMDQKNGVAVQYSYGIEIDKRYGPGTAARIIEQSKQTTVLTDSWLREQIAHYKELVDNLQNPQQP